VEAIYRGQNWECQFTGLEWNKNGLLALEQMFGTQTGSTTTLNPILGPVGDRWTTYCQPLVLTAILGNPPTTPQSLTAVNCGFKPQHQVAQMLTSKLREFPLQTVLLPYSAVVGSLTLQVPFTTT
jgi:hypothetical protein